MVISWFSCGVTSAVATKLALQLFSDVSIVYIDTGSEHPDSKRFLHDCEKWYGKEIMIFRSGKYVNHFDVIEKRRYINSPFGAPCTKALKKDVRYYVEDRFKCWDAQVFGFDISEKKRAERFREQYPGTKACFPLLVDQLTKTDCMALIEKAGIELPMMYRLGFHNNNCIGCVKGRKGYWCAIRKHFPDVFDRMARLERLIGHSCISDCFLDELGEYNLPPLVPSCSLFCDPDFMDI